MHEPTLCAAPERLDPTLRARLEAFSLLPGRTISARGAPASVIRQSIADLYRQHRLTALVTPTAPATATIAGALTIVYTDREEPVHAGLTRCTMPFNTTGQPALSLPCGFDLDGLPVGLQIVGRPDEEWEVCRIGHAFQSVTDHHLRRPGR